MYSCMCCLVVCLVDEKEKGATETNEEKDEKDEKEKGATETNEETNEATEEKEEPKVVYVVANLTTSVTCSVATLQGGGSGEGGEG